MRRWNREPAWGPLDYAIAALFILVATALLGGYIYLILAEARVLTGW